MLTEGGYCGLPFFICANFDFICLAKPSGSPKPRLRRAAIYAGGFNLASVGFGLKKIITKS